MGPLQEKSFAFSVRVVNMCKQLRARGETVMSRQVLRSGTSVGANIAEGQFSGTDRDMMLKFRIALKECSETVYWLDLLCATDYLTPKETDSMKADCGELAKMLNASIRTLQSASRK